MPHLNITNLQVRVQEKLILQGVDLHVGEGEVVGLLGPNGSGKSTLAQVVMGHPEYAVIGGEVTWDGKNVLAMKPEERARAGLFLSFQHPQTVAGVSLGQFLRLAYNATHAKAVPVRQFVGRLAEHMDTLGIPKEFMQRSVNEGFSGGEKKRAEILQLLILEPRLVILDETDSGLDIDALRRVTGVIAAVREQRPTTSFLVITHYPRLLEALTVHRVAVMERGKIVESGSGEVAQRIASQGFGGSRK